MKKYLIIYNGNAGTSDNKKIAEQTKLYVEEHGRSAVLSPTQSREDAVSQVKQSVEGFDCLM